MTCLSWLQARAKMGVAQGRDQAASLVIREASFAGSLHEIRFTRCDTRFPEGRFTKDE